MQTRINKHVFFGGDMTRALIFSGILQMEFFVQFCWKVHEVIDEYEFVYFHM